MVLLAILFLVYVAAIHGSVSVISKTQHDVRKAALSAAVLVAGVNVARYFSVGPWVEVLLVGGALAGTLSIVYRLNFRGAVAVTALTLLARAFVNQVTAYFLA